MNHTEAIVVESPEVCSDTLNFTIGADDHLIASDFLYKIMTKITEPNSAITNEPDLVSSGVTARENDILEYIAGYTMSKASAKF